jgi:cytidine deaminase
MHKISDLYDIAYKCRENAYAPYSGFKVGAAILSAGKKVFSGCNVENASYPCGNCAEAGAISAMAADGERIIKEILIVADTAQILPCGNCLQKIAEFADETTLVHSADLQRNIKTFKLAELLPQRFSAKDL